VKEEDEYANEDVTVWDIDHPEERTSPRPQRGPSVARTPSANRGEKPKEAYDVVYVHCSSWLHIAMIIGGVMLGMLVTIALSQIFGPHGTLSTGITPIVSNKVLPGLTPDAVKAKISLPVDYRAPALLNDLSMYVEHGDMTDPQSGYIVICNIYEDAIRQQVFGIEVTVDASMRPIQDEAALQDVTLRCFENAPPVVCNDLKAAHINKWLGPVMRIIHRPGAVSETTIDRTKFTCYGTPWTRTLVMAPK